ncbi:virulence factor TspB C-terminal domain-related protein [Stutzerimonas nosocomialis]|uniref:virulence factor TspB C-terminal domain-related protein n=1 Tax=Stutzerimonas nosocomialis TaxID=1056496 RepID=UPI001F501105|nr:virulence factor TspB C-terminal domain-related protein [Stutzerimonas nosocomialis]
MNLFIALLSFWQRPTSVRPTEEANRRRPLLFSLLLSFSQGALAADYYWQTSSNHIGADNVARMYSGASPSAVCDQIQAAGWRNNYVFNRLYKVNETTWRCEARRASDGYTSSATIARFGDSCPVGAEYKAETGECISTPEPSQCTEGDPSIFKGPDGSVIDVNGSKYVNSPSPGTACYNRCSYTVQTRTQSCFYVSGSTTTGFCNYLGSGTGESCNSTDAPLGTTGDPLNPPGTPDVPPSDPNDPGCPSGYSWSGTTCVKTDPGDGGGDGGDGGDTGGGSDGGTGGGGSGGSDGGSGGSDGGSGGDTGGGSDGGSGGGGGGGSGGDGGGQCDPATNPACVPGSVTGPGCDQPLVCTGDVVSCAILKQQKEHRCHVEQMADFDAKKGAIEQLVQGEKFELDEQEVEVPSFINTATRFLPSSCPAPNVISTSGRSFSWSYEPACEFASTFSWLFVAIAALWAAVYVGAAFGGND